MQRRHWWHVMSACANRHSMLTYRPLLKISSCADTAVLGKYALRKHSHRCMSDPQGEVGNSEQPSVVALGAASDRRVIEQPDTPVRPTHFVRWRGLLLVCEEGPQLPDGVHSWSGCLHLQLLTQICILILTRRCSRTGSISSAVSRGAILARTSLKSSVRCAPLAQRQWRESALPRHDLSSANATDLSDNPSYAKLDILWLLTFCECKVRFRIQVDQCRSSQHCRGSTMKRPSQQGVCEWRSWGGGLARSWPPRPSQ